VLLLPPALAGCLGESAGCWVQGAVLTPDSEAGDRLLAVDVAGDAELAGAFRNSSLSLLFGFPGAGDRLSFNLEFEENGSHGTGIYGTLYSHRDATTFVPASEAGMWHPFRIWMEINSSNGDVASWIFFGEDNSIDGAFLVSNDRQSFHVESPDVEVDDEGGSFTVAGGLRVRIDAVVVCT
jgi:hypothetical protein